MGDGNLLLQVDPELTFSVNTQIKEQLKWLIGIGQINPGDMLPAASQLAVELGLNRNTVNWVYTQLRDEGLVSMQKGRGTQVIKGAQTEQLRKDRLPMQQLLENTIHEARSKEIDLQQFFMASLAYVLLHNPRPAGRMHILLVECKGHDHHFYRQAIEQATSGEVETLFLEDLNTNNKEIDQAVQQSQVIITTLNHAEEVKAQFARYDKKVLVIGATVDPSLLVEIAKLKQGATVAFVCLGKVGGEWMASRVQEAGIQQIHYETLGWDEHVQLADKFQHLDKIYASAAVFTELIKLIPEKVKLFPMQLEKGSENLLQDLSKSDNQHRQLESSLGQTQR